MWLHERFRRESDQTPPQARHCCPFIESTLSFVPNLGFALPAYLSLRALETPGHDDDVQWLTYWVIFGAFTFVESFSKVPLR
ncbi:ER membrane protein DP1/Yop1 [Rhodosporidiobolus nylandii]